ncbi:hypothetical protein BsWGS_26684 [Bradybaena similaris]
MLTVFTAVYSELDEKTVNRKSDSDKHRSSKYFSGKHTSLDTSSKEHHSKSFTSESENKRKISSNAKYTEEKADDYNDDKGEKQYNTGNTGKGKNKHWEPDYGNNYKGDFDGGEDNKKEVKKDYSDDSTNDAGPSKDTYTWKDNSSPGVTCSHGVKFLAHPYECTKFYQCAHMKPFLFTCPSGLYFNTDIEVCDWPSNVDCYNGDEREPNYKTSYKTAEKSKQGPSYQPKHEPDYDNDQEYKVKSTSNSHPQVVTSHKSTPTMDEDTDVYEKDTDMYEKDTDAYKKDTNVYKKDTDYQSKVYSDSHSYKDSSKYKRNDNSMSSKSDSQYPLPHPYQHMMAPFLPISALHFPMVPVMQPPIYPPYFHAGQGQSPVFYLKKADDRPMKTTGDETFKEDTVYKESKKEDTVYKESKKEDDSSYRAKKTESSESKTHISSTDKKREDEKTQVQTVKKVIIKKSRPVPKQDVSAKDKTDDASTKKFYYYYYDDDSKDSGKKVQEPGAKKDEKKTIYYYYDDGAKSDSYKDKRPFYDYDNKFYYDDGSNFDYNYEGNGGRGNSGVQHFVSVDNKYSDKNKYNDKRVLKTSADYKKAEEMSEDELGFIHFNHMGRRSKPKAKGEGMGDIGSLLPLLLLGGANGGQQLLITSLLLSGLKSGGTAKGEQSKGRGNKDDLIKQLVLLSLLNGNGNNNNNNIPTANAPNIQLLNGQFVNIATGQPAVLIDPGTGQQVTPAQVSVNPTTGQLIVTATGNPVFLQDPATGNLQPAVVGNAMTLQGNPLLPAVNARRRPGRRVNFGANVNNVNNRFIPLAPVLANQNAGTATSAASGRDAVNLIFLSPLTPSSLPPPINNDGSATLIRGSLLDILGPNLASFISNVPLVPGQGPPNSAAGSKQSCNVVRSGETVPFRISPRGGRLLPSECDAIGKLLDKFVPTFLQNFVPSDAAFAGFGTSNNNRSGNNSQQSATSRPATNEVPAASGHDVGGSGSSGGNLSGSGRINDFINVRNDHNGCTIAVPNIVSQC